MNKKNILFLCTGNSCRSQMAEGLAKKLLGDRLNFYSAGTKKNGVHPIAIEVLKEVKVDISKHQSKNLNELSDIHFNLVFTVCSSANEECPYLPGLTIKHVPFDDPPFLTQGMDNKEDVYNVFRRVRDQIKEFVLKIDQYID